MAQHYRVGRLSQEIQREVNRKAQHYSVRRLT